MGNGCSSQQNNAYVMEPKKSMRYAPQYHEVPDSEDRDFAVSSFSGANGSRSTGLMKTGSGRGRSGSTGRAGSPGRRSSMSRKEPPVARNNQSMHAFQHYNSMVHQKSGEEVRQQAEDFEKYGNDVEVSLTSYSDKDFPTLFGDLESRDLLFEWNDRFELGVTFVDKQHFKLVELVNELHHAEKTDSQRWIVGYVLEKLIYYTDYHFKAEEEVMERFSYEAEATAQHKQKHKDFVSKVVDFRNKFQNMQELDLGMVILEFLKNWLANHILHTDVKMCLFFRDKLIELQGAEGNDGATQNPYEHSLRYLE